MPKELVITKDWKFYTAIVASIALAGTGIFLISSHNSYLYQKKKQKSDTQDIIASRKLLFTALTCHYTYF